MTTRDRAGDDEVSALIAAGRDREAALRGVARSSRPPGGTMDPINQLEQLMPTLGALVSTLTPEDLAAETPCSEYTVQGVLEHMVGGGAAFAAGYRGDEPHEFDTTDILPAWEQAMTELAEAVMAPGALDQTIAAPFGEVSGDTFARFVALDGLVHGWDIATATGKPYAPSDDLVAAVDGFAHEALDPLRDGDTFAAAVAAPADASPITRLAAYTGRQVR
ncbi:TIGR03086 family metal-binding protein [Actinospongicola halichondriae]|uniref:TIGR03086 family metal-binding protein n=1 Tax=Actinospongicola halichondriae TaxID=3236844 RepID=UPI003D5434E4